ncbi:MarR family winged helix-turn-helix transcriptional regulator [Pseudonocardia sp. CA-107938]|uniref:MarR family winged helix-turn-helix transcriptional regulator n=1 Tax=Pseudonocardia sp. CA-107938 TaxID=3240021 RepID=UPI003D932545
MLKHAQSRLAELAEPHYAALGVTGRQVALLTLFADGPPLSQQDGAAQLGIDRTTMVALVDELEEQGLVRREVAPGDRRKRLVTEQGERVLREGARVTEEVEDRFLEPLAADDARRLREALHLLVER